MVRKPDSKRLRAYARVKKHQIWSTSSSGLLESIIEKVLPTDKLILLYKMAVNCFMFYGQAASKLHLVPYSFMTCGKLRRFSGRELTIHYTVLSLLCLSMMHKLLVSCYQIFTAHSPETMVVKVMCIIASSCYFIPTSVSISALFLKQETACILNTWGSLLPSSQEGKNQVVRVLYNTEAAFGVLLISQICLVGGIGISCLQFAFAALPVSYFAAADALGLVNTAVVPVVVWKFILWPLELVTYLSPLLLVGWCAMINQLVPIVTKDALDQLRYPKMRYLTLRLAPRNL